MSRAHTKGPWHVQDGYGFDSRPATLVADLSGYLVASTGHITKESQANANLIAAAPALFDALHTALPFVEDALEDEFYKEAHVRKAINEIMTAIKKARGES